MDKETLSNYGWITIVTLVLAVMLALATPFGTYIGNGVVSIARGYVATSEKKISEDNINKMKDNFSDKLENGTTSEEGSNTTEIKRETGSVIPNGAKYTIKASNTVLEGNGTNKFPDAPAEGDTYEEGDYKYTYDRYSSFETEWRVVVKNKTKTEYGEIISEIVGEPMTCMSETFSGCTVLTTAPTIPNSVTDMSRTFENCQKLTTAPTIPNSVTDMAYTFASCESLTAAPTIPDSVTNMSYTFFACSLTTAPAIPSSVTHMFEAFAHCTSLTTAPTIPNSVTDMYGTFYGCTALTTAPTIPSSVTDMEFIFNGCTSLTGTITINANPTSYYDSCFRDTVKPIILTGSSTMLNKLAATANNGNVTVK